MRLPQNRGPLPKLESDRRDRLSGNGARVPNPITTVSAAAARLAAPEHFPPGPKLFPAIRNTLARA